MPAVEGAIYFDEVAKAEKQERITRVTADKLLRTHAVWDLGWNDSMSIIMVQRSASELRVIDYIEDSHKKLSDYVLMLRGDVGGLVEAGLKPEDAAKHAHRRGYTWGDDWIPHDGFAKDYKTGKSADEMLRAMGRSVKQTPSMDIEGGIKAAREVFERVWFDKDKAARLIECLKRYRRNIGQRTGEAGTPLHDEFSHGADAFRYMGLVADQLRNNTSRPRVNLGRHEVAGNGGFLAA
jgi:phage terminase large subunit